MYAELLLVCELHWQSVTLVISVGCYCLCALNQFINEAGLADICLKPLVFLKCFVLNVILDQPSFTGAVIPKH